MLLNVFLYIRFSCLLIETSFAKMKVLSNSSFLSLFLVNALILFILQYQHKKAAISQTI